MAPRAKVHRIDGLANLITGLGRAGVDKTVSNYFAVPALLTPGELEGMYRGNGVARRIIDKTIREMTREWFTVSGDTDDAVNAYLEKRQTRSQVINALRWAHLYGGSLVFLGLDDGEEDISKPLNEGRLKDIVFLRVFERRQVTWTMAEVEHDMAKPLYNRPVLYRVTQFNGPMFVVHESRTLRFIGAPVNPRAERENMYWGDSVFQSSYDQLKNAVAADAHAANIVEEWAVGKITIKNLIQLLAAKDGEAKVMQRLSTIDLGKHILRSVLLAEGEDFQKLTQSVNGLPEVIDRFRQSLSAAHGMPITLLYGEAPGGMRSTGKINQADWYDEVRGMQEEQLVPQMERLVRYTFLAKNGPTSGVEPKGWGIELKPLEQPTQKDEADLRKAIADTDVLYIQAGVLEPEEVAVSRFGGDRYSTDTVIDESLHKIPTAKELAAQPEPPAMPLIGALKSNGGSELPRP